MKISPACFHWVKAGSVAPDVEVLVAEPKFQEMCRRQFGGFGEERIVLTGLENRSMKSHDHFFACVARAWENLPDDVVARYPTAEHLRKWALVQEGWCDEQTFVMKNDGQAAVIGRKLRKLDEYAVITVRDGVCHVFTAKSMSGTNMKHEAFQECKDAVLGRLSQMCGIDVAALRKNAGIPQQRSRRRATQSEGS